VVDLEGGGRGERGEGGGGRGREGGGDPHMITITITDEPITIRSVVALVSSLTVKSSD
jgi:hypothetical protein